MHLVKWNPARRALRLRHPINSFFDDFLFTNALARRGTDEWNWNPVVDIFEEDDAIIVSAEIPGMDKDNISVDVKDRVLTLKGERSMDNAVKEEQYYRRERRYGQFQRTFSLPSDVNPDDIKAEYTDGVLKVTVPKPEKVKPKQITIH